MIHLGADISKRFSYVVALDEQEKVVWERQVDNSRGEWQRLREELPAGEAVQTAMEAGWNWGITYDLLEEVGLCPVLVEARKARAIADAYIKTDKLDAYALARLLKSGLAPRVHVPERSVRDKRNVLRHRMWLVGWKTSLKNRMHGILDRNHVTRPEVSDLFGRQGKTWLKSLELPVVDQRLLKAHEELYDDVVRQLREMEHWVEEELKDNPYLPSLLTLPGVGKILGAVIALEVDTIERFRAPEKLCSYAGLVNSTYASGDKVRHGGIMPTCNKNLRYAYVEAAWTAVRTSPYFAAIFRRLKAAKGPKSAIVAIARRLCMISWSCMKERRAYREQTYRFRPGRLAPTLA